MGWQYTNLLHYSNRKLTFSRIKWDLVVTDGFVSAYTKAGNEQVYGYTDSDSGLPENITTLKIGAHNEDAGETSGFLMPVRENDYWKTKYADKVWWIPLGN